MHSRNRRRYRPKAEEEDDNPENHCPSVDDDAKDTRKMERSPNKLISLACTVPNILRFPNITSASAPEEKAFCDDVRSVEAAYAEGDDIVESG